MNIQKQAFEKAFKQTEIYKREVNIRQKDILEFSNTMNGYFNIVANDAWNMWQQAQKVAVPEGFLLVNKNDLITVLGNCSDAMGNESTSSVYDKTGEPSTWYDHHIVAETNLMLVIGKAQEQAQ